MLLHLNFSTIFRHVISFAGILFLLLAGTSCSDKKESTDDRPFVVTTTNLIRDAVEQVAGDDVRVISLMGPGVDPHLYRATPGDFHYMEQSDLVLYNGMYLEGRLSEILDGLGEQSHAVTSSIPRELFIEANDFGGTYDPHIWFDVSLWQHVIVEVAGVLGRLMPDKAGTFHERAETYNKELTELHIYVQQRVASIPEERRVLITAHDAFQYFGKAYEIEVRGLQGLSTATEFGIQDVTRMVQLITQRKIPAIFVETSVSTRSIDSVIAGVRERGYEVKMGGSLYSDSMGARGTPEGTYTGMVQYNVDTIVTALAGDLRQQAAD